MEGRRDHRHRVVALATAALLLIPSAVRANEEPMPPIDKDDRTATVYTTPDKAVIEAELKGSQGAPAQVASRRSGRSCHLERDTGNVGSGSNDMYAARPNEESFVLYCDGQWIGLVWVPTDRSPRRAPTSSQIRDVTQRLREEIPMPAVTIAVNPTGAGLVGVESWFWVEGYRGEAITHSTSGFGLPVELEARPTGYRWGFGDGTFADVNSLGKSYPEKSEIRHTYQRSSAEFGAGFPIDVQFSFEVRYRIAGGSWVRLEPISRSARLDYPVRESQAVITR